MSTASQHALSWKHILVAVPVGIVASLVTLAFRHAIALTDTLLFSQGEDITQGMQVWPWYLWPLIVGGGGVIAGFFLRYALRLEQQEPRRSDYLDVINARLDAVPGRTSLFRSLSSLASISSGASVGREGPMVQLAALSGSLMGRWLFKSATLKNSDVVAMAATAGLASVYHAPLAAAIFVAEIGFGISAIQRLIPLVVSAAVAVLTMWALGYRSAIYSLSEIAFNLTPQSLLLTIVLGLLAGFMGWGIIWLLARSKRLFSTISYLPLRLGLGGILVGVLAFGSTGVLGNGYEMIVAILSQDWLLSALVMLLVLKLLATAVSVGSGAVGGLFTPSLLMGALTGAIVAQLATAAGFPAGSTALFAAIGMGAMLAAVSQAPLMAMLMVLEMTLNSSLLFPTMIACVLATMTVYRLHAASTYPLINMYFRRSDAKYNFDNGIVSQFVIPGATLTPQESAGKALALSSLKRERFVYVINDVGRFLGVVSIHDIAQRVLEGQITLNSPVSCVMDEDFPFICAGQTIKEGWDAFARVTLERLPVVNNPQEKKLLGALTKTSLIQQAKDFL